MARIIVIITAFLWMSFFVWEYGVFHHPLVAFFPLYGLYPGVVSSDSPGYSPTTIQVWAVGAGIVFLSLAVTAMWLKSKVVAIAFMVLFLASAFAITIRISSVLHD